MSDAYKLIADPEIIEALRNRDLTQPIGALNQLKFRRTALYPPDSNEAPCTGEEAYARYAAGVIPILKPTGATPILTGSLWLLGRLDEWDRTFIVRYPHASDLLELMANPDYHKIVHHRTAALADSRLLIMDFEPSGLS